MAQDVADWTQAVNVTGGSVSITGTATVTILGTPAVTISGTPTVNIGTAPTITITGAVTISSGTVNIGNTPSVTISGTPSVSISGTPTVILGAGTASVGSISAISSTVTVAGTINIGNTPAVTISGTPTVNIAAAQTIGITGTVTVDIGSTGTVNIGNTPTVILGAGTATVGTISAISSTVTVAGTINVGNTPSVTISGTPTVNIAAAQTIGITGTVTVSVSGTPSVSISGTPTVILGAGVASVGSISAISSTVTVAGTINIGNTPAVTISGTPTVNIGNTPAVTISGTPAVTISSGSVSISGTASISIVAQSITVAVNQPQTNLGSFTMAPSATNNATYAIPVGTHAIGVLISGPGAVLLRVSGVTTGIDYLNLNVPAGPLNGYFVSPVLSVLDTSVKVWSQATATVGTVTVYSVAILTAEGVFTFDNANEPLSVFINNPSTGQNVGLAPALPLYVNTGTVTQLWEKPDVSSGFSIGGLAINGTQLLRAAVAGQRVYLFAWRLGTDAVANDAIISLQSTTGTNIYDNVSLQNSVHGYDSAFYGALGELGAGVQMKNTGNIASGNLRGKFVSSQG